MATNWRLSSFNGALLAAYFIPAWSMLAYNIAFAPVHALYDLPNISAALYVSDQLQMSGITLVRLAWLLALARITVVVFFAVFVALLFRPSIRKAGGCDEALAVALGFGSLISFGCMLMASRVGETAARRRRMASCAIEAAQPELAGSLIARAVDEGDDSPLIHVLAGRLAMAAGQADVALGSAERALAQAAKDGDVDARCAAFDVQARALDYSGRRAEAPQGPF